MCNSGYKCNLWTAVWISFCLLCGDILLPRQTLLSPFRTEDISRHSANTIMQRSSRPSLHNSIYRDLTVSTKSSTRQQWWAKNFLGRFLEQNQSHCLIQTPFSNQPFNTAASGLSPTHGPVTHVILSLSAPPFHSLPHCRYQNTGKQMT